MPFPFFFPIVSNNNNDEKKNNTKRARVDSAKTSATAVFFAPCLPNDPVYIPVPASENGKPPVHSTKLKHADKEDWRPFSLYTRPLQNIEVKTLPFSVIGTSRSSQPSSSSSSASKATTRAVAEFVSSRWGWAIPSVLSNIFSFASARTRFAAMGVTRYWRQALLDTQLWYTTNLATVYLGSNNQSGTSIMRLLRSHPLESWRFHEIEIDYLNLSIVRNNESIYSAIARRFLMNTETIQLMSMSTMSAPLVIFLRAVRNSNYKANHLHITWGGAADATYNFLDGVLSARRAGQISSAREDDELISGCIVNDSAREPIEDAIKRFMSKLKRMTIKVHMRASTRKGYPKETVSDEKFRQQLYSHMMDWKSINPPTETICDPPTTRCFHPIIAKSLYNDMSSWLYIGEIKRVASEWFKSVKETVNHSIDREPLDRRANSYRLYCNALCVLEFSND